MSAINGRTIPRWLRPTRHQYEALRLLDQPGARVTPITIPQRFIESRYLMIEALNQPRTRISRTTVQACLDHGWLVAGVLGDYNLTPLGRRALGVGPRGDK